MSFMSRSDLVGSPDFAEAVFLYCSQDDVFDDFCDRFGLSDISLCEYVAYYRFNDFLEWYQSVYPSSPWKVVRNGNVLSLRSE